MAPIRGKLLAPGTCQYSGEIDRKAIFHPVVIFFYLTKNYG